MDTVRTVTGDIAVGELGVTLAHEHLWCDISPHSGKADNILQDEDAVCDELSHFQASGGKSILEMTCEGIGRDPGRLASISRRSGVQIVSGVAFYDESTYPSWVHDSDADRVADYFIGEIESGRDGVKAGLIGELMSHNEAAPNVAGYRLHEPETKIFQAAAAAQRQTGVAISTHAALGRAGHAQLAVLEAAGADLARVAIGHCDAHWSTDERDDLSYYLPILRAGAFCSFDMIGWTELTPDEIRAQRIAALVAMGYEERLLLSTDTCRRSQWKKNGGRGFDYLWTSFLPRLHELGVKQTAIRSMLETAPRKLLAG